MDECRAVRLEFWIVQEKKQVKKRRSVSRLEMAVGRSVKGREIKKSIQA